MLGYFPDPYPDELFYSLCARFSDVMQYPKSSSTALELLGTRRIGTLATLPTRMDRFAALLPPLAGYTAEQIINEHTLFPYYSAFLPAEQKARLLKVMREETGTTPHIILGQKIALQPWLRFCPVCVDEERRSLGECYWHRLHQVLGVEVCPVHRVFLQNSSVPPFHLLHVSDITSAQVALSLSEKQQPLNVSNPSHQILLQIAYDTAWLLSQHHLALSSEECRNRYLALLREQGLATYSGTIHKEVLAQRFLGYYMPELLERFSSPLDASVHNHWLARLLRYSVPGQPPIRHLLVLQLLGSSPESFFGLLAKEHPFGEGPWPCLNTTCEHYRQAIIPTCQITHAQGKKVVTPRGVFACSCGFVYSRKGPDQVKADRFRIEGIRAYGPRWEAQLQEGWSDSSISLQKLANQLGVSYQSIINQAARLGLPFPRRGMHPMSKMSQTRSQNKGAYSASKQEAFRKAFTAARDAHPEWRRVDLSQAIDNVYRWLLRNDQAWLDEHRPSRAPNKGKSYHQASPEWRKTRDASLAQEVRDAALRLRNASGPLVRITRRVIGAEINQLRLFSYKDQLAQFPLTTSTVAEIVETPQTFAVRRIWWIAECYRQQGMRLTRDILMSAVGGNAKWDQVRAAIDTVLLRTDAG